MVPTRPLLAAALAVALASPLAAQGRGLPDSLVNTKIFPRDTPVREVVSAMRGFTAALGVRCDYCHVERQGVAAAALGGLPELNFPSDDKRTKRTARLMMLMVRQINDSVLGRIPERPSPSVAVACVTCHRGVARPKPLTDIVTEAVAAGGLDSAVRAYRALRQQYYGRAAYDFGEGTLLSAAGSLMQARRPDDALRLLDLDAEFFPTSPAVVGQMGEVFLMKGDSAGAVAKYRQALQLDPNDRLARMRLRALGVTN
jgi:tetratricopeptide (TPR) repeat protein